MAIPELTGKIQTVLGIIDPDDIGITLPHEHIVVDGSCWFQEPTGAEEKSLAHAPVSLDNLWWVRYHWLQNLDDIQLIDEDEAIAELSHFQQAGGRTVVDMSNLGLGRNPLALARISRATGLHILMGSGHYLAHSMPNHFDKLSEAAITDEIVNDIIRGVGDTGIRAGLIGEIGCSFPMDPQEEKSLRAAIKAQKITGANLNIHPGLSEKSVMEILKILQDEDADLEHTTIDHMERTVRNRELRLELLKNGLTIEYDLFGREGYYPLYLGRVDIPNDHQKIDEIMDLIAAGYISQILISQDIWNKHHRRAYGGWGYDHILRNVMPVMRAKGMSEDQIHTLIVDNPKRMLQFK